MSVSVKLSIIDDQWPCGVRQLVRIAEQCGYSRFWATEHHSPNQSASPIVAAAIAAGLSTRIRVGTAGVLLKYTSSIQVAEAFQLLELNFPGRMDLGVARAKVEDDFLESCLLDGRTQQTLETYQNKILDLARVLERRATPGAISGLKIGPSVTTTPQIWMCGSSADSAAFAGLAGISYSFHHFIGRLRKIPSLHPPIQLYRDHFRPVGELSQPRVNMAIYGACASTDSQATNLWESQFRPLPLVATSQNPSCTKTIPAACFLGDPKCVRDQILTLQEQYGVDEFVVNCAGRCIGDCMVGYELVAEVMEVGRLD